MQRPDEQKRLEIMAVAARLFSTRAFHEVRLEDVAASARVGKGTVYVYFDSKEDLFLSLIRDGFARLVDGLRDELDELDELDDPSPGAWHRLERIVDGFVAFATRFPHVFRLMRSGALPVDDPQLQRHRRELAAMVERTIRSGVRRGELVDPHPALTAQYLLSFVRGAILFGPRVAPAALRDHLLGVIGAGIRRPRASRSRRPAKGRIA